MQHKGLKIIEMEVAATRNTNSMLAKLAAKTKQSKYNKALPKTLPATVGHTLFYGPGGTGKTTCVEEAVALMGCKEADGTFIRLSAESFTNVKEFVEILQSKLSWQGYLCDNGQIDHSNCTNCKIIDPVNPRGAVKQIAVFIDEIHAIDKATQIGLLLILLDFRYQFKDDSGQRDVYFPRFTFFGATTDPGLLSKPLRTRFKNKIGLSYYSDKEMIPVVYTMAKRRGLSLDEEAATVLARCSQGIPREAGNHVDGLYACWCFFKERDRQLRAEGKDPMLTELEHTAMTGRLARRYIEIKEFLPDGMNYNQIRLLNYLNRRTETGKFVTAGIKKILDALGWDEQQYADEIEPRLVSKGYLDTTRSRKITAEGVKYLNSVLKKYPNLA